MPRNLKVLKSSVLASIVGLLVAAPIAICEPPAAPASAPAIAGPLVKTDWFAIHLMGQEAGYLKSSETTSNGEIETESLMQFSIARGQMPLKMRVASNFVETESGKPLRMKLSQEMAASPVLQEYVFTNEGVECTTITTGADGKEARSTTKKPLPAGEWLTPAKLARVTKEKIKAGEKKFSLKSIDSSSGLELVTLEQTLVGNETLMIGGKPIETTKWLTVSRTSAGVDIPGSVYLDADLEMVRTDTQIGAIGMKILRADASVAGDVFAPPEMFVSLFVEASRRIDTPRRVKDAEYVLSVKDGEMPTLPSTGGQKFERIDKTSAKVTVSAKDFAEASEEDVKNPVLLGSSALISTNDSLVKSLSEKAVKGKETLPAHERAELMRRFVYNHIKNKQMDKGFAGAAEVARTCSGDCSEHGVLLAALLRANGIPARVVCGAIYVEEIAGHKNVFGYHMWTQALVELDGKKRWVDLDATLPGEKQPFDATHLAIATTPLEDGDLNNSVMNLVPLLGRLQVKVEKTK